MIFRELSNAAFRFVLRRTGAQIDGGCSNTPPPIRWWKIQRPSRARVKFIYQSLRLAASYTLAIFREALALSGAKQHGGRTNPPRVPWKDAKWPVPARVNPRPAGPSPTLPSAGGGGEVRSAPIYLDNQKTWRKNSTSNGKVWTRSFR